VSKTVLSNRLQENIRDRRVVPEVKPGYLKHLVSYELDGFAHLGWVSQF
jgi:hypothetical protein